MTVTRSAPAAPEVNHLRPVTSQPPSGCRSARVAVRNGSVPGTPGSVMA